MSVDGQIGTTAFFSTSSLSVGTHTISFKVQDNNGAWSGEITAQLIVSADTGMGDAIDVVVDEILPEIPEILEGDPYWCLKLDSILPPGTVIEEDSGSTLRITLEEELFFFYLDLAPGTYYGHPVKYILVDGDGNHEEYDSEWWPRIDGVVPSQLVQTVPDDEDVIATNVGLAQPTGTLMVFDFPMVYLQMSEGFIVVQGLMLHEGLFSDANATYLNGIAFFTEYRDQVTPFSRVEGLVQSQAALVLDTIDDMVDEGRNPITIYIIAHGGTDTVRLGGLYFSANQFHNKMAEYPDTTFNFMLGSCHSGSFIDNLNTLDNVCVVETACRHDQGATGDWDTGGGQTDFNSSDTGSEWTSSILEAMSEIVEDEAKFNSIRAMAYDYGVSETCVLICIGSQGALGISPAFGLTQDLDFSHRMGGHDPCGYCSFYGPIE